MVFSNRSQTAINCLKVIDIDRLKPEKSTQVTESAAAAPSSALFDTGKSFSEEFLRTDPVCSEMFHDSDSEFFQDLGLWCATPAMEAPTSIIDEKNKTEETALDTITQDTLLSPQGWVFNVHGQGAYEPLSPLLGANALNTELSQEQFLDISSLPVVFDMPSGSAFTHKPFIEEEEAKQIMWPEENTSNDSVASDLASKAPLKLDVWNAHAWGGDVISTPDVLSCVEQLERENPFGIERDQKPQPDQIQLLAEEESRDLITVDTCDVHKVEYSPVTPKTESHVDSDDCLPSKRRKRHDSEDSDETYTPYEVTPRKYKRRKPNIPIKDMILALEGNQQQNKARRGRPPKRRESVVSSVESVEDNSSCVSSTEYKYREMREKNNEASKRSRMNRKLKELQSEQLAIDLEERNKKLKVKADILEDMTKRMKAALMKAILHK